MDQERLPIRGSLAAVDRNSLTKMYREFGDRWEIEQIPPGVRWIAVYRENNDEYIRLVLAHDVGGLRYCMTEAENETPEEREEQGT
ncbi:MAG TPA: hypothetical protein VFI65_19165 [Streptosporangiaceae bacterium]|nr:hypothetical protein [Streptosporangiaceae bacterium]